MAKYNKQDFRGGLNQFVDPTKVDAATEHYLLVNGRVRRNIVEPVLEPLDRTSGLPATGTIQGAYAIESYQVVFINGEAWYRNFAPDSGYWSKIVDLQMSTTAERIYVELVPASTVNFVRKASSATDAKAGVTFGSIVGSSPRCAIVMDGESQPWVIFPDATARITKRYNEWQLSTDAREYVPAACILPMWFDGVLYCVGKDLTGTYNQIYRSATGRPLDFIIAVTTAGDKTSTDESIGGAPALAYRPVFDGITAMRPIQSADAKAFLACTLKASIAVIPTLPTGSPYNEPVFSNQPLFPVGAINDQSVVDITNDDSADTAIIHFSGIRSFNGVMNLKFEGRNAPFSRWIDGLIAGITQQYVAATTFDNYGVFALDTKYGPAILWFDMLTSKWVSVDIFEGIGTIKQFSVILTKTERRLFFITTGDKFYEYFAGENVAPVKYYIKDLLPENIKSEHSLNELQLNFSAPLSQGYVSASAIIDGRLVSTKAQEILESELIIGSFYPMPYPISSSENPTTLPVQFGFSASSVQGRRVGVMLEWSANMSLQSVEVETVESTVIKPEQVKARATTQIKPTTIVFIGEDGYTDASRVALNQAIKRANPDYVIGTGGHTYANGTDTEVAALLTAYWGNIRSLGKFYATPGRPELSTRNGEPFFSALRQDPTRYFKVSTDWADLFIMNAGINNSGVQIEPDNLTGPTFEESRQMLQLKAWLAESTKRHKIVVWNATPYSSLSSFSQFQGIPLAEWGATCHVGGGVGFYERLRAADLSWFISSCGASGGLAPTPTPSQYSQAIKSGTVGYLQFEIWPLSIETKFVALDGSKYDNFVMYA